MKKMIIALVVVLALIAGIVTYVEIQKKKDDSQAEIPALTGLTSAVPETEEEETPEAEEPIKIQTLDYDALYASRNPDEVVMTVGDTEITWDDYYYWLEYFGQTAEYYMTMYSYYGMEMTWEETAPMITENAEAQLKAFTAIEKFAEENEVDLNEEQRQEIEDELNKTIEEKYGEANEKNRAAFFEEIGISEEMYYRLSRINYLYQNGYAAIYGEDAGNVAAEDAVAWLEENGYMYASHILFATMDFATMEDLGETVKAEKEELAKNVAAELQAIKDPEKLTARFRELKEEYCEDTGKAAYPDGYLFVTGAMVEEFENGYKSLTDYQVSDPILSTYGYHVMLRLPLDADAIIEYSEEGEPLTARQKYANVAYGKLMDDYTESMNVVISDSLKELNILDYLID